MAISAYILENLSLSWNGLLVLVLCLILLPFIQASLRFYRWFHEVKKRREGMRNMPGPKQHWFWGNLLQIPMPGEEMYIWSQELAEKFPKYNSFAIGWWKPEVTLRHPDPIKKILKTSEPKPTTVGGSYDLLKPWLGDGLLVSSGKKWFRNRKLLTPGFHFDVLKPYMTIYNQAAETLIGKWEKEGGNVNSIEIYNSVSLCTLDVMLRCAFSYDSNVQLSENKYVTTVNSLAELLFDRAFKPWLYADRLYYNTTKGKEFKDCCQYAHRVAYDLINTRQALLKNNSDSNKDKKFVDFLDILLLAKDEKGKGLLLEEIRQEVDTFLFEGHDTTASAISWILYSLAKHPAIQKRCQEEVDALFTDPTNPTFQWEHLQKIPYLAQCIKEGLRMYSPVPFIQRELTQPIDLDGHILLPKTTINILIFNLHHNPVVWGDDHNDFKPERFHTDEIQTMDPHAFIPFSAGPRNCIGQNFAMHEIKVVIARLLQHFEFTVDESHKVEMYPMVVTRAKNGIKLFMKPRQI